MSRSLDALPSLLYQYHAWRRSLGNFTLYRHRRCDAFLVSMHQSGTHWLKYMLACALAEHFHVPGPRYNHANDIIGGPKDAVLYPQLPRIVSSHSIPGVFFHWRWLHHRLALPKYVILVRDLRDSLISNYEKWRDRYAVGFTQFLRGDPAGHRYNSDIWWCLRFMNAWGRVAQRLPDRTMVVRYEALQQDPRLVLERIDRFIGLSLTEDEMVNAIKNSNKELMAARDDPDRPPGAVRMSKPDAEDWWSPTRQAFLSEVCSRHLRHDFGYDFGTFD